jgi:two-component system heavy metal sensor histidine kinase CusS
MSSKTGPEIRPTIPDPRRWSLAARLTAWYAGTAFLLILAATGFLYWALVSNLDREDDQFLVDKIHFLRMLLRDRPQDAAALKQEAEWEWAASQYTQFYLRIRDDKGRTIIETPGMSEELPTSVFPTPHAGEAELGPGKEVESPSGKSFRVLTVLAAEQRAGSPTRIIEVALDRTYEEDLLARYRRNLWLVLGLALVVCALAAYQIARRGLQSVAAITATAGRIHSTTLDERLEVQGLPAELFVLAGTFNEMLDRLEESFARLSQFSADIAHELRTPVNNLRGEAEVALGKPRSPEEYREVLGSCLEECGRLTRIIDSLLFLARAESPETQIAKEPVDVGRELLAVREFYEAAAAEAGVTLKLHADGNIVADLDRTLFQRALSNLVANALAHTPPGGVITLTASHDGFQVHIAVTDTGRGIPKEHLPHVFDRFYRVDQARSTTSGRVGLGLAIVKSIAVLHHGTATITSEVGRGTRVTLVLPGVKRLSASNVGKMEDGGSLSSSPN